MRLSEKIYQLRRDSGMSQEKLAEILNISRQTVSKWESDASKPDAEMLLSLSKVFDISIDALLKDEIELQSTGASSSQVKSHSDTFDSSVKSTENHDTVLPTKKRKPLLAIFLSILVIGVVGSIIYYITELRPTELIPIEDNHIVRISEKCESVLLLEVYDDIDDLTATASGFIIDDGTTLVTNYHVIKGAYKIVAKSADGLKTTDVNKILTYDEKADLAILECESNLDIEPLNLGNSDLVSQGDNIFAIGYPLGVANTLSEGIISSRYVGENQTEILQITAAISQGSSGGALLNEDGFVIGVIFSSYVDGQNLNLAVASNCLSDLLTSISSTPILLKDFFWSNEHPRTVAQILRKHSYFDNTYQHIEGYVSSAFAYSAGGSDVIVYYIVSDSTEILGYDFQVLSDLDNIISYMRVENQRIINYGSIMVTVDYENALGISPGDFVSLYGRIKGPILKIE